MPETAAHIEQSHILIIERDKRTRSFLSRALQKKEHVIIDHADNTLQAIEHIQKKNFDFVFIDSYDSVLKTHDAVDAIKTRAQFSTKSFILIMKELDVEKTVHLMRCGFHGFITKPFHADIIHQKMDLIESKSHPEDDNVDKSSATVQLSQNYFLLADGNERYRKHITEILSNHYNVIEAVTGFDALVFSKMYQPRKIILSSSIDVIEYETVIQKIRAANESKPNEIYVTLFDTSDEMRERIISLGATNILKRTHDDKTTNESLISVGILPI